MHSITITLSLLFISIQVALGQTLQLSELKTLRTMSIASIHAELYKKDFELYKTAKIPETAQDSIVFTNQEGALISILTDKKSKNNQIYLEMKSKTFYEYLVMELERLGYKLIDSYVGFNQLTNQYVHLEYKELIELSIINELSHTNKFRVLIKNKDRFRMPKSLRKN